MMKSSLLCCAIVGASMGAASWVSERHLGVQTVNTTSGLVSGHTAGNTTAVAEYLGIPFAQPPLGDLRFAPPKAYTGTEAITGTAFGFGCVAITDAAAAGGTSNLNVAGANITASGIQILSTMGQLSQVFSEDCLTLNVWVPSGGEAKKAVLLWIYGGGFISGSTSIPEYNGKYLAQEQDVIVVSVNYRLNIFGFPGNPSEPYLNLGLLDQRLGVQWVSDNIAAFGGDPTRITMFGQSAGSASLDYYSYAYPSDPLIAGIIQESGTINGLGAGSASINGAAVGSAANAARSWFSVTSKLGCGNASSNSFDVLTCMRRENVSAIMSALPKSGHSDTSSASFGPAADNLTVFTDYLARSTSGNFSKVPLLIGNNDYEAGLFAVIEALSNVTLPAAFWDIIDRTVFTCPSGFRANISIYNSIPTWRYRYFGSFPNTKLTTVPDSGAWHGAETLLLFDSEPSGPGFPADTDAEVVIGKYVRGAWAAFAKDPAKGLSGYGGGWPLYDPAQETLVRLGYQNLTGTNVAAAAVYDVECSDTFVLNGTSGTTTSSGGATPTQTGAASTSKRASGDGRSLDVSMALVFLTAIGVVCLS